MTDRRCPHCAEPVRPEASVCPHCTRSLDGGRDLADFAYTFVFGVGVVALILSAAVAIDWLLTYVL